MLVEEGHGAAVDVVEAVADDEIGGAVEDGGEEVGEPGEVVGEVAVGHDEDVGPGGGEAAADGGAVAAAVFAEDDGAGGGGEIGGAVDGAVVDDDDFAGEAGAFEAGLGGADDVGDGSLFVEAGNDDGNAGGHGWLAIVGGGHGGCPSFPLGGDRGGKRFRHGV